MTRSHSVGRNGRMVKVWEFRTANAEPDAMETVGGCQGEEVTRIGAVLRRLGIGRWPLLLTVLRGDLSMVGPRAELPRYVGCYPTAMRKLVLSVKPGLVDLASIEFRHEQKMLASLEGEALEEAYVEQVLPMRLEYAKRYIENQSLLTDVRILLRAAVAPFLPEKAA
jgi:lipopolysaccharide/colanic/teichoic acid biosynthesis glycosyltransferase